MKQNNRALTIGLMGNSGCGKSTVSAYLKQKGAFIIDADEIAHRLMKPGERSYNGIIKQFGNDILNDDMTINRKKLGDIVFNDKKSLEKLNEISHNAIVSEILRLKENELKSGRADFIVIDAPLLTETGLNRACDRVWLVYADYEKRIERIIKRDGITAQKAEERLKNQTAMNELEKFADEIIDNSNDNNSELLEKIDILLEKAMKETP